MFPEFLADLQCKLGQKLNLLAEDEKHAAATSALQEFQDEAWRLSRQVEAEYGWASYLILFCYADLEETLTDPHRHVQLRLALRQSDRVVAAIQEAADDLYLTMRGEGERPRARHSPCFRSVYWYGTSYAFTGNQAACVKLLWEMWENDTPDVSHEKLVETAEVSMETGRVVDIFKINVAGKSTKHPAWGTMIVSGTTKGICRLQEPQKPVV